MSIDWWMWAILGIALILAELVVPSFVLIWFGLGALGMAILGFLLPGLSLTVQIFAWLVASVAMVVLWFKLFKPEIYKSRAGMSDSNIIGEVGLLVREVAPFERGRVRFQKPLVGSDVWDCIADQNIASGERVKVLAIEGSLLKVGPA